MENIPQSKLKIEHVAISSLKKAEYNPRRMTEKQESDLTESIIRFGLVDPLLLNSYKGRENIIIGGHQRLKIAEKLKFIEVPVVYEFKLLSNF